MDNKEESQKVKSKEAKKEKKMSKEGFKEIEGLFRHYWKVLFLLIGVYIFSYLVWHQILWRFIVSNDNYKQKFGYGMVIFVAVFRGLLFGLDGWVTSLLKTPFNQMCYAINKTEGIAKKKKNYIITKATESNEHCKETLKKFGILNIGVELIALANFLVEGKPFGREGVEGRFEKTLYISYLIPLVFSALAVFLIHRELQKIKRSLIVKRVKKSS